MNGMAIARNCLHFAAPIFAIAVLWWLVNRTDRIVHHFFPHSEWEKSLGWLNIRAERRANAALRWVGYAIYAALALALYGMVWAARGLSALDDGLDLRGMAEWALQVLVLGICLGAWVLYLGGWLIPKLRAEHEEAGLKKFRAEMEEAERAREMQPRSRIRSPLRKPRVNAPLASPASLVPERTKRRWSQ